MGKVLVAPICVGRSLFYSSKDKTHEGHLCELLATIMHVGLLGVRFSTKQLQPKIGLENCDPLTGLVLACCSGLFGAVLPLRFHVSVLCQVS